MEAKVFRWTALGLAAIAILLAAYMGRYSIIEGGPGQGFLDRWTGEACFLTQGCMDIR